MQRLHIRARCAGASAAFIGRRTSISGETGARFVTDMFTDELRTEMKHVGIQSVAAASQITVRHPGAWRIA